MAPRAGRVRGGTTRFLSSQRTLSFFFEIDGGQLKEIIRIAYDGARLKQPPLGRPSGFVPAVLMRREYEEREKTKIHTKATSTDPPTEPTKYGFSGVRYQLLEGIKGVYPTKWKVFRIVNVLGEDVSGSPKPHPNAVLNLFEAQNVRFAIPFAAYRAPAGGFSSLMSDKPGTVLPRRTLATWNRCRCRHGRLWYEWNRSGAELCFSFEG